MIRTKIIATMGPASGAVDTLRALFEAGVDVCRLNFSHGSLDEHLQTLRYIREAAIGAESPIAVLGDLCGPKIRLGDIADVEGSGGMPVVVGDEIVIQRVPIVGRDHRVSTAYPGLIDDLRIGDRVLVEDGLLHFVVTDKDDAEVKIRCTAGGVLKSHKGINLPHTPINLPSITERDWECVKWAVENDLDYLALSFVRNAEDILLLRKKLRENHSNIRIIAKIEKGEAIQHIDSIIDAADGLMVARGDLGVEMDVAEVPILQKDLVRRCQLACKPVIVATQMLQSMIESSSPTRAEVSDVANAIFDGTDAVMLSGETAVGKFPVGAVHTMAHVAQVTEEFLLDSRRDSQRPLELKAMEFSAAIANGIHRITRDLEVRVVVVYSQTGATAQVLSKSRLSPPIVALSGDHRALRRMALHWGVIPQESPAPRHMSELVANVDRILRSGHYAEAGDRIIIVTGSSLGTPGTLNGIVLHTVGEQDGTEVE